MKKLMLLASFIFFAYLVSGCGGQSKDFSKADTGEIPEWFTNTPQDPNYIFAPTTASSQDMQLAIDKAVTAGRAEIGRQMETKVNGMQKKFEEEVGAGDNATLLQQFTQATKTVVSVSLSGSSVKEKKIVKDGNLWRAYVLVQYPIGAANDALMQQIKKNNEMYTRFRSTQAFDELDKEVQKYEDFKSKQKSN